MSRSLTYPAVCATAKALLALRERPLIAAP